MKLFLGGFVVFLLFAGLFPTSLEAQATPAAGTTPSKVPPSASTLSLRATSTLNIPSEMGGAFMNPAKCDAEGNLYIRKLAMDRPQLGPVVKIGTDGQRAALFDPAAFSQLALDRADAFSPAPDGGLYQIAQSGVLKPRIYVLHFSSDGSASSPVKLDADLEVYAFAAFADGNFLVSGARRATLDPKDRGHNFTAVFSADGRELAQVTFAQPPSTTEKGDKKTAPAKDDVKAAPTLDLADAEAGSDSYLYVMRRSSPALVYVIASSGRIMKTLKVGTEVHSGSPAAFHVSGNRLAISFWNDEQQTQTVVIADAQTGRKIASYADPAGLGPSLACYSANDGVFTFLKLGDGNALQVVRAEAQ
jgi:hypothetical protein